MKKENPSTNEEKLVDKKRSTLLSVQNAEAAMVFFTFITLSIVVGACIYLIYAKNHSLWEALTIIYENNSRILSAVTILVVIKEGVDIVFTRLRRYLDERKNAIEKIKREAYQKGFDDAKKAMSGVNRSKEENSSISKQNNRK